MARYHILKHFHTVNKHRFHVFVNCCKCGIPWRGLVHDLSKYSPKEFLTSAKNYTGTSSPIGNERKENDGYSYVFIHHTRKNKHHFEYWVDVSSGKIIMAPMPYKYAVEYCCDVISASEVYNGKKYTPDMPLAFFEKVRNHCFMHSATKAFVTEILTRYKDSRFRNIHKKDTKKLYAELLKQYPKAEVIEVFSK